MKLWHWMPIWGVKEAIGSESEMADKYEWLYFMGLGVWNGLLLFGLPLIVVALMS